MVTACPTGLPAGCSFPIRRIASATFCVDPEQARTTRRDFLSRYADRDVLILGTHFASPTAGHIVGHGDTWRLKI